MGTKNKLALQTGSAIWRNLSGDLLESGRNDSFSSRVVTGVYGRFGRYLVLIGDGGTNSHLIFARAPRSKGGRVLSEKPIEKCYLKYFKENMLNVRMKISWESLCTSRLQNTLR